MKVCMCFVKHIFANTAISNPCYFRNMCVRIYDGKVSHSLLNYINTTKRAYNANNREHYFSVVSYFALNVC